MKGVKHRVLYMRTRKVFRMPLDKILCLSANAILTIIALWSIASVFFETAAIFFFQAEDGIRDFCLSRGLGDVYKRQQRRRRRFRETA